MSEKLTEADFDQWRRDAEYQANRFPNDDWPPIVISLLAHIAEVTARAEAAEAGQQGQIGRLWDALAAAAKLARTYRVRAEVAEVKVARVEALVADWQRSEDRVWESRCGDWLADALAGDA